MKKFTLFLILVILSGAGFLWWKSPEKTENKSEKIIPTETPAPTPFFEGKTIEVEGEKYAYAVTDYIPAEKIVLLENYAQQTPSETLMKNHKCTYGINGGFYDTFNKPLGWLVINGEKLAENRKSQLFNGYVSVGEDTIRIGNSVPETDTRYGLQTGPILITNGRAINLQMATDKNARRMVLGIDNRGRAIFLTYYSHILIDSGPMLELLPQLVQQVSDQEGLGIFQAVNLDGGSASAFDNGETKLLESKPVGSWWCAL